MLDLPEFGFHRSVKTHNCDLAVVCDWIESSLLLDETEISQARVCDILREQQYYPSSDSSTDTEFRSDASKGRQDDFCAEFAELIWGALRRRERLTGDACFYSLKEKRIVRRCGWDECPALAFLILLSCAEYYESIRNIAAYIEQGELFEDFCCEALIGDGWKATRTGWASHKGAQKLPKTVAAVAEAVNELMVNAAAVDLYKHENEAGCDLVSHRDYADEWTGRPIVLVQCASGSDFRKKLGTPRIDRWCDFIAFSTTPLRGFCTPRAFEQLEFRQHSGKVKGVLVDRFRLIAPFSANGTRPSKKLEDRLTAWIRPRLLAIPKLR